jgi:hypothetical protein
MPSVHIAWRQMPIDVHFKRRVAGLFTTCASTLRVEPRNGLAERRMGLPHASVSSHRGETAGAQPRRGEHLRVRGSSSVVPKGPTFSYSRLRQQITGGFVDGFGEFNVSLERVEQ